MFRIVLAFVIALAYLYPLYALWDQLPFLPYLLIGILGTLFAWLVTAWWLFAGTAMQTFVAFILSVVLLNGGGAGLSGLHNADTRNQDGQKTLNQAQ